MPCLSQLMQTNMASKGAVFALSSSCIRRMNTISHVLHVLASYEPSPDVRSCQIESHSDLGSVAVIHLVFIV